MGYINGQPKRTQTAATIKLNVETLSFIYLFINDGNFLVEQNM